MTLSSQRGQVNSMSPMMFTCFGERLQNAFMPQKTTQELEGNGLEYGI